MAPAMIAAWNKELRAVLEAPEMKQRLIGLGLEVQTSTPAEFAQRQSRDLVTFAYTAWQPSVQAALTTVLPASLRHGISMAAGVDLRRPPSALAGDEWVAIAMAMQTQLPALPAAVRGAAARLEHQQANLKQHPRARSTGASFESAHPALERRK